MASTVWIGWFGGIPISTSGSTITFTGSVEATGQFLAANGSASAPSYSFTNDPDTGWYRVGANDTALAINGATALRLNTTFGVMLNGGAYTFGFASGEVFNNAPDTIVAREAAGHWFQRNSTNAQRASWANTYTSATNYSSFSIDMQTTASVATVGTRTAASGTGIPLKLVAQASSAGAFGTLQVNITGAHTASTAFSPLVSVLTDNTASAIAYTAAQVIGGLILRDCNGAGRADTVPTAANLLAVLPGAAIGQAVRFTIRNTSSGATSITVTAPDASVTTSGTMVVAQNNTKDFIARFTNVTAASEAYTLYSLGTSVF